MSASSELRPYTKRVWLTVAIVAAVLAGLAALSWLLSGLLVIFAGVLFGVFLNQLSRQLAAVTPLSYRLALAIVVVVFLLLAGGTTYFMGSRISQQVAAFSEQLESASGQLHQRLQQQGWQKWLDGGSEKGSERLLPDNLLSTARSALLSTLSVIGGVILVMFLGFYFALQSEQYRSGMARLLPPRARPRALAVIDRIAETLWWWILGRLLAMLLIGVGSAAGLGFLGVPLPITLGVFAGLMNFVPNLGPLIASIPAILFALQQGPETAIYVAGFYLVLQFVESYFITPWIDQQQVSLPPALILSSQLLFGMLAGFLGLLLATPLTAVGFVLVHELYIKDLLEEQNGRTVNPDQSHPSS